MNFKIIIKKSDDSLVTSSKFTWSIKKDADSTDHKDSGTADTDDKGILTFVSDKAELFNYISLKSSDLEASSKITSNRAEQG